MKNYLFTIINKIILGLKSNLRPVAKLITNKKIRSLLLYINDKFTSLIYKRSILKYYNTLPKKMIDTEKKEVLEYLKSNPASLFPYEFTKKYKWCDIKVFTDSQKKLKYTLFNNKKLFFKRSCTKEQIKKLFSFLLLVQDIESPHRYLTDDFNVSENDIVADIGSAEGDFSLSIIEKVKKIYLFETDSELIEALHATFEPWKEKVVIINKYVSNKTTENYTTLDSFFLDKEKPTFIKVDIEGAEYDLLCGAKKFLFNKQPLKVIIAAYHRHNDEIILNKKLIEYGFKTKYSNGYMLSIWDDVLNEPYLRRGLIRAVKP